VSQRKETVSQWEYRIVALPTFQPATSSPGISAAVRALNDEGTEGWEAVGMTVLNGSAVAVLFKRALPRSTGATERSP